MVKLKTKKKGQSTVEYVILVAAVLALLILFLQPNGVFRTAFNKTVARGTNGMQDMASRLKRSRPSESQAAGSAASDPGP